MRRMNISTAKHKRQALVNWQNCVTQAIQLPILIDSLGVLEMAKEGDWVGRSRLVGRHLRDTALKRAHSLFGWEDEEQVVGGLDGLLFVQIDVHGSCLVMGTSNAGPWVRWTRWLPRMDEDLTDRSVLESVLEPKGCKVRLRMSQHFEVPGMKPEWCFWCGNHAVNQVYPWCRFCCIDICDTGQCAQQLLAHKFLE